MHIRKGYPVPDIKEIGFAPNSHTQLLRGYYAIVGAVWGRISADT